MRAANWVLALLSLAMFLTLPCPAYGVSKPEPDKSLAIGHILSTIVAEGMAPGMIAAVASHEGLIAIGSAGLRKTDHAGILSSKHLVHLGSCTKAMTAMSWEALIRARLFTPLGMSSAGFGAPDPAGKVGIIK